MKHETLYKRAKTGKIVYWDIETRPMLEGAQIKKIAGELGTLKPKVHVEPIHEGKNLGKSNETSPLQQANSQAKSDWEAKRRDGYKTLYDLNIIDHGNYVSHAGQDLSLAEMLDTILPEFNTTATGDVKPMKAPTTPWKPGMKLKLKFPLQYEPKMDGRRAFLIVERQGPDMNARFVSSGGKPINTLDHLLIEFLEKYDDPDPIILDGELYCHGKSLNQIGKMVTILKPDTHLINFHIFDIPSLDASQTQRSAVASAITLSLNSEKFPVLRPRTVHNEVEIMDAHDEDVAKGYEGGMLKELTGRYQPGQRSSHWLKVKMFDDNEYEITGHELGQRGVQDLAFVCKVIVDGVPQSFNAVMNGSLAFKQELYETVVKTGKHLGAKLTVKHFGFTDYGIPNLPKGKAIRDDDDK
jgi:ATP-dependent DNA ligase